MKKYLAALLFAALLTVPTVSFAEETEVNSDDVKLTDTASEQLETEQTAVDENSNTTPVIGWQEQDGKWFYYDKDGNLVTDEWIESGNAWYYVGVDGAMLAGDAYTIDGKGYFFNRSGAMAANGWATDGHFWYYAKANGELWEGWLLYNGQWYYFFNDVQYMVFGPQTIDGKVYLFDRDGALVTKSGWIPFMNDWYYINGDGTLLNGWLSYNNQWYYLLDGRMATGAQLINGQYYYFDASGANVTRAGWVSYGQSWYYIGEKGVLMEGWLPYNGQWYYLGDTYETPFPEYPYFYKEYAPARMAAGYEIIDGQSYYFDANGIMATNSWVGGEAYSRYYAQENGVLKTGWFAYNGEWYYLGDYMVTGTVTIGTEVHYFNSNGVWQYQIS
ncbi:hypothetical protein [Niallia oryzisoli]|uniref:hypothetical protein n=1 Tax=Niallia oryzisoli TaxID=1737571 RepID=UPI0037352EFE